MISIIDILFYPIFFTALTGIAIFIYTNRNDKLKLVFIISLPLLPIGWRLIINISSQRYAILLVWPAIFFSAFAYCRIVDHMGHSRLRHKKTLIAIFNSAAIGIVILLIGKTLHLNPYRTNMQDAGVAITQARAGSNMTAVLLDYCGDGNRLAFFAGIKNYLSHAQIETANYVLDLLPFRNSNVTAFVAKRKKVGEAFQSDIGGMKLVPIFCRPVNRKEKQELVVYQLDTSNSTTPKIQFSTENIFRNSDLTQSKSTLVNTEYVKKLMTQGNRFSELMPENWNMVATRGWRKGADGYVEYSPDKPPSLLLRAKDRINYYTQDMFPADNYKFTFKARIANGTLLGISLITYPNVPCYSDDYPRIALLTDNNQDKQYTVFIDKALFTIPCRFRICLELLCGEVEFYNFELYREVK